MLQGPWQMWDAEATLVTDGITFNASPHQILACINAYEQTMTTVVAVCKILGTSDAVAKADNSSRIKVCALVVSTCICICLLGLSMPVCVECGE